MKHEFEAKKLADRILRETYHHRSVEVWEASQRILVLPDPGR